MVINNAYPFCMSHNFRVVTLNLTVINHSVELFAPYSQSRLKHHSHLLCRCFLSNHILGSLSNLTLIFSELFCALILKLYDKMGPKARKPGKALSTVKQ